MALTFLPLFASISLADSEFVSERCYANRSVSSGRIQESFFLRFESKDGRIRTLDISKFDLTLRFRGTSLKDLKWVVDYHDLKLLEVDFDSVLTIHFRDGRSESVGQLAQQCLVDLRSFDAGGLEIEFAE